MELLVIALTTVWLGGGVVAMGLCAAAAAGDRQVIDVDAR